MALSATKQKPKPVVHTGQLPVPVTRALLSYRSESAGGPQDTDLHERRPLPIAAAGPAFPDGLPSASGS